MDLETLEERELLKVAEELARLAVRLRAMDRLSDAMTLEDLIQQMTSTLTFIRASREQEQAVREQDATASGQPAAATGAEDLGTVRGGSTLADQLRSILGQAG